MSTLRKRPATIETLHLAIELLQRIPRTRKVSAAELQRQLAAAGKNRDLRTIQRQLETLSRNFDIERDDRSKPYGYRWKERAVPLSVPSLTPQQSLLLTLAEQHLRNLLPASLTKSMEPFFTQARSDLGPGSAAKREREWLSKVRVVANTQPLLPPKLQPGVFEQISNALYDNTWLDVTYKNSSGKLIKADIMPLGLAQQGARLYLVCRFDGRDSERSLALNRFIAARATMLPFERPKSFSLQKFEDEGRFGFGHGKKIRLTFRISKAVGLHLLESRLSVDQGVKEHDDCYAISATVVETELLNWWLMSFGDQVWAVRRSQIME